MSISGIEALGFTPMVTPTIGVTAPAGPTGPSAASGSQFSNLLADGISSLESMNDKTDSLAVKAATGDLGAIHEYTVAATETQVATQLTVAVRNKAVEAFNEIMRMQV